MKVETVGKHVSKWGEGPVWYDGKLYYVDINGCAVIIYDPTDDSETIIPIKERVGTVVMRENGGLVIAGDTGFHFLDPKTGETTFIHDPEPDIEGNRFNDGKCSPDGRFFAGSISLVKDKGAAKLYQLDTQCTVTMAYEPVTNSNGIVWTADGQYCYYIDTPSQEIKRFDYDMETGALTNMQVAFDTKHMDSSPDGMAIDIDGKLWIAFCHGGCVIQFDPTNGKELTRIDVPCRETTACAFGGDELQDLYITTGLPGKDVEPDAGRLFVVKNVGTCGLYPNKFKS